VFELVPVLVVGIPIAISDIRSHRIPNRELIVFWVFEEICQLHRGWHLALTSNITSLLIFITGCILHLLSGTRIGMGDIKLFALLVLPLGNLSRSMTALTSAAIIALIYAIVARKSVIPFGPALLLATVSVILSG
jgi:Flp pilus assembly protein protease CpaA